MIRTTRPFLLAAAIIVLELFGIGVIFKHTIDFDCRANWPGWACRGASMTLVAIYCVAAGLALFAALRKRLFTELLADAGAGGLRGLGMNALGFVLCMVPALFIVPGTSPVPAFAFWIAGMTLMLAGVGLYLAPLSRWRNFFRQAGSGLPVAILAGAAAPALVALIYPLWRIEAVADLTFRAVRWLVAALGYQVTANVEDKVIGDDSFLIAVAPVCSGVEGIALVTLFVSLFLWLFRAELRFPIALLLYPLGILASAMLNVVRITLLLILGIEGYPELAVGGFHSHAGWVMFTLTSLGIIAIARNIPAFLKHPEESRIYHPSIPFFSDPSVLKILPFAVFMLTGVVAPAVSQYPALLYPIRIAAVVTVLGLFWPLLRQIRIRIAPAAIAVGLFIGLYWVLIPVSHSEIPPYGNIGGTALVIWFILRGLGTVLVIPLIEELFFRDYLESRIGGAEIGQRGKALSMVVAALVTAVLFAFLHERWVEAFFAGLLFSAVARRSGRIGDAILAHAVANLIVFAGALLTGNLAMI